MIGALSLPQPGVLLCQHLPKGCQLLFHLFFSCVQVPNFRRNRRKGLLQPLQALLPGRFIRLNLKQPGIQFRLSDVCLFHHGVKASHPGFNGGPPAQFFYDGIFTVLHAAVKCINPLLNLLQLLSGFIRQSRDFRHLSVRAVLLMKQFFPVPYFGGNLILQRTAPAAQMGFTAPSGINLLLQNVQITLKAPSGESGIGGCGPGLLDFRFQLLDFLLDTSIFILDTFI